MKGVSVLGVLAAALVAVLLAALQPVYAWSGSATGSFEAKTGSWESGPSEFSCRILTFFQAELRWSPTGSPAEGYRIYHKGPWPFDGDFGLLTQIADSSVTSYDGLTLSLLRHSYYMTSYFDSWESPPTETISVYCRPRIFFPGPCELEGENHHSQRVVELAWEPVTGAVSYGVLRGTEPGGPYEFLDATAATAYSDAAVSEGVTYYYVIVAVDAAGNESDPSGELVIEDTAPTPTPTPAAAPDSAPDAEPSETPIPTSTPVTEIDPLATLEPVPPPAETGEPSAIPTPTPTVEPETTAPPEA